MSNRTLIELNHDYSHMMAKPEFLLVLARYLASSSTATARPLERYGVRVVGMRHHSDKFIIDGDADGFPPQYLNATGKVQK